MKIFIHPRLAFFAITLIPCGFLTSCAASFLLGEGAVASGIGAAEASMAARIATRAVIRTVPITPAVAESYLLEGTTLTALAAGSNIVISDAELLNINASFRRGTRLGLTSGLIEEHTMMRAGSQLILQPQDFTYAKNAPVKLFSPQGNLIATLMRNQNNVIIRNAKGGVISNTYISRGAILHYTDGESKVLYGFSLVDNESGLIKHYLVSAETSGRASVAKQLTSDMGIYIGQDKILKGSSENLKDDIFISAALLASIENRYPGKLLPTKLPSASERLEKDLVPEPKPPRNEKFKAKKATWSKDSTTFKIVGFTINPGMVATAQIEVTNLGKTPVRLGLDAVATSGFQARPILAASLQDSSGTALPCVGGSGIYSVAGFVGLYDSQKIMGDQNGGYEQLGLERWFDQMNEVEAGGKHIITLKFQLPQEEMPAKENLDLNLFMRATFYSVRVNNGKYGKILLLNSTFEGIVPGVEPEQ